MMQVLRLGDGRRQDAQGLAHEAGLQADVRIADFAFDFRPRHQGGHRVDDDDVHGVRLDQHLRDLERFLAVGRLADQQALQIDAEALGPAGIEGVLGVDEGGHAAQLLGAGDGVQGHGGLAARFRAEDLDRPGRAAAPCRPGRCPGSGPRWGCPARPGRCSPPSCMIAPLPNCFSICCRAFFSSRSLFCSAMTRSLSLTCQFHATVIVFTL